jgi:hypothetical protein
MQYPKPYEATPSTPHALANNAPPPLPLQQAPDDQMTLAPMPNLRTAYSTPPASDSALLTGALPVTPASSFESRWTPLR